MMGPNSLIFNRARFKIKTEGVPFFPYFYFLQFKERGVEMPNSKNIVRIFFYQTSLYLGKCRVNGSIYNNAIIALG